MANKGIIKQLLMSNNYWVLNKEMVKLFGLEAAFLLSNFAEAETLMADDKGWFYQTSDTVESMTTLSRHKQDQAVKVLERTGVLEKAVKGLPPKRYFRINYECLTNLFVENQQINLRKIDKSICEKSATSKEHSNKERSNKESISSKAEVSDFFESLWKLYPKKRGKNKISIKSKKELYEIGFDEIKTAIDNYKDEIRILKTKDEFIQNGSTFFNGGWGDYSAENYEPLKSGGTSGQVTGYDFSDELI